MPRPDLSSLLGINYRRIPLLAIGRDIYCDTHLIIQELERRYPPGSLGEADLLGPRAGAGQQVTGHAKAWTGFLEDWANEVFVHAVRLLPEELPLLKDKRFQEDRKGMFGKPLAIPREETLSTVRTYFHFIETTLLSSSSSSTPYISGPLPTLNDIVIIFPIDWLITLPGALPSSTFSPIQFPNLYAWHARFKSLFKKLPDPRLIPTVTGAQAKENILLNSGVSLDNTKVTFEFDKKDPLGLSPGELVEVTPTDSGRTHPQRGRVCGIGAERVSLEVDVPAGSGTPEDKKETVRVHFPRRKYSVKKVGESKI